jgi:hypothetical protein
VVLGNQVSDEFQVTSGVPQGGILSPLLFNIYLSELGSDMELDMGYSDHGIDVQYYAYADDLAISISGALLGQLLDAASQIHDYIRTFLLSLRLELNLQKSGTMLLTHLRPAQLLWPPALPQRVSEYKYLGCTIDSKLLFKTWCSELVKAIRIRVLLIKRLSCTRKLSRRQVEVLYQSVIRGKLNYASSIWSRSHHAEKVFRADTNGLRITMGALLATPYENIQKESNLSPLQLLINRSDLRLCLAIRKRPLLSELDEALTSVLHPLNETSEHTFLYQIGMQPFLHGLLDDNFTEQDIRTKLPSKAKRRGRISFKNELTLARFRMGRIPSRSWAKRLRLSQDSNCRHCGSFEETSDHLLNCPVLDYSDFTNSYFSMTELSEALNQNTADTFELENSILKFIARNDLFKMGSFESPPSCARVTSKRIADISPSPANPKKKARKSKTGKRRTPDSSNEISDEELQPFPPRGFSGPAPFLRQKKKLRRL